MKMSPRLALTIIASLFVAPVVLAWLMYAGKIEYTPSSTRNRGELVEPPVPLSWDAIANADGHEGEATPLQGHWVVLRTLPDSCGDRCLSDAAELRQVHLASGRQQSRIRLVLLQRSPDAHLAAELHRIYPAFHVAIDRTGSVRPALDAIAAERAPARGSAGSTYLIDPLGNIMMFYEAGSDPNDLKSDLKRLLTWSKLDEHE